MKTSLQRGLPPPGCCALGMQLQMEAKTPKCDKVQKCGSKDPPWHHGHKSVETTTDLFEPFVYHCLEDLSHDQGDPHNQEVSADDAGNVNGTGSPRHGAGPLAMASLKSRIKVSPPKKEKDSEVGEWCLWRSAVS